jgi:peptide/nickel transport system substrate-binding protein
MMQVNKVIVIVLIAAIILSGLGIYYYTLMNPSAPEEKILVVGHTAETGTLFDPSGCSDRVGIEAISNIYDTLYRLDYDAQAKGEIKIVPWLAADYPQVSSDGLEYTISLRRNVTFHDGTPFNASCVKYNFDRHSQLKRGYAFVITESMSYVKSEVIDEYTIKIVTKNPVRLITTILTNFPTSIASPSAIMKYGNDTFGANPVGTGPWKFVKWERNVELVLERNDDYFFVNYRPKMDKIIIRVYGDPASMRMAMEKGEIDVGWNNWAPQDALDLMENQDVGWFDLTYGYQRLLMFNVGMEDNPINDVYVRRAICYCIDREEIAQKVFKGFVYPTYSIVGSLYEDQGGGLDEYKRYDYNITKATALLAEAGYPNGVDIELWYTPIYWGEEEEDFAVTVQEQLAKAGIRATLKSAEWGTYTSMATSGQLPLSFQNQAPVYPHIEALISGMAPAGAGWSKRIGLNDTQLIELYNITVSTANEEERKQAYVDIQNRLCELVTWAPIVTTRYVLFYRQDVKGVVPWIIFHCFWAMWEK